ncbi:OsmC family peroxiredoxin [Echinicola jeungdonensis]|uniref:OsmC family peroxiredoxin n=1 Tax=Echinicola jeungdonensis TaxID=709343 RepID=A0ABV5J6V2_9BACT|nr:OsmC family peroxiredoxin [Echinicola jeungdonensis]MDN3670805.1 OsmC family peroxiredoxin [Echinicola jeungdonensis]
MKFNRRASANWKGGGKDGKGTLTTQSKVLDKAKYSANSRFEDEKGTNPEELVGAAHAGCFSMKLAFVINEMGHDPQNIDTDAKVTFEDGEVKAIHLDLKAKVEGMNDDEFQKAAKEAKETCPISMLLKKTAEITMDAKLV